MWLPTGWDPEIHCPRGVDKTIDTVFIGTATPRKKLFLDAIEPRIFGNGWAKGIPAIYLDDYCKMLSAAKISINIHRDEIGVNRRLFESIGCTFTLTDNVPGVEEVLGKDLARQVAFDTPEQGRTMVMHYLSHQAEREKLWQAERLAIMPYTYDEAVKKVLSYA